jgi:SCP1.201-like deaminase
MANLIPVDYDPFMGAAPAAPNFIPVDHDPFAAAATEGPTLIPVDHDPFADNPAAAPRLIPVDYDPFSASAAAGLIPVDHDPFAGNPSAAPKLIPVDYDPFALPDSAADASQPKPKPQASISGPGISTSPATPLPDQGAPANQTVDPTVLRPSAFNAPASRWQNPPASDSLSFNSLPVSFWPRRAPIFPVAPQQFGKLSPGPRSLGPNRGQPDQTDGASADAAQQTDLLSPGLHYEDSEPSVILAGDYDYVKKKQQELSDQLDLFNETVWGIRPRFGNKRQVLPVPHLPPPVLALPTPSLTSLLRSAVASGKLTAEEAADIQKNVSSRASAEKLAPIIRPMLPRFDGNRTYGILITNEGNVVYLGSGGRGPDYSNYESSAHVEGKGAIWIRQQNSSGGVMFHNNDEGTCGTCDSHLNTLLPENVRLWVFPPENAVARNSDAITEPKEYVGNSKSPKPPSIKGTEPAGADDEN